MVYPPARNQFFGASLNVSADLGARRFRSEALAASQAFATFGDHSLRHSNRMKTLLTFLFRKESAILTSVNLPI